MIRALVNGRVTPTLDDVTYLPTQRAIRNPVIYCHGGAATATQATGVGLPAVPAILRGLVNNLFTILAPTMPADQAGNPACRVRIGEAIAYSRTNLGASGPAVLLGTSMGATGVLNYAADNPSDVAAVIGFIPLIDLEAVRASDSIGLRAVIDAAYGVSYPTPLPPNSNPAQRTGEIECPVQLWTASDDSVSLNAAAFSTAVGADHNDVGPLGHDNDALAAVVISDVIAFVETSLTS